MSLILAAFDSSIATGSVLVDCKSIGDPGVLTQSGDGYVIDKRMKFLLAAWAFGTTLTRAQVQTPTFAQIAQQELTSINTSAPGAGAMTKYDYYGGAARALSETETLICQVIQSGGGSVIERVLLLLADAVPAPSVKPDFTIQFTAAQTLVAEAWTNFNMILTSNLPKGSYAVVGARVKSTGAVAARLRFVGAADAPGFIACQSDLAIDPPFQRHGGMGVLGIFDQNLPPTMDLLSTSADTSESGELDLVKVA